ncbi:hypothetical protein CO704_21475 [Cedecea neteri]|uniref:Uncharacterized protein n=1 Tax=Cedecea neteri TaxID=158822 RepID=A0A291E3I2_9ENTR|nr:hypothetical protein CO704_21475 [Cedecea neteri]
MLIFQAGAKTGDQDLSQVSNIILAILRFLRILAFFVFRRAAYSAQCGGWRTIFPLLLHGR